VKVLLVAPPLTFLPFEKPRVVAPLGISYIAAFLERNGQEVRILDAVGSGWRFKEPVSLGGREFIRVGLPDSKIREAVSSWRPDIVGVTCLFSSQAHNAHKVARLVKSVDGEIATVFGGAHPSVMAERTLQDPNVDFVVTGEGEVTMLELVKSLDNPRSYPDIMGLAFKKDGKAVVNPPRPFIADIDSLPLPARHLLPMEEYFRAAAGHGAAERKSRFTSMITSRGCPRNCIFCSIHTVWGHSWRPRSPEAVLDELELLVREYRVEEVHFEDDNLTLNPKRMEAICDGIMERGLDISWATPNGVDINTLNRDLLKKMRDSGCYWLCFGLEHGDPYFRDKVIGKSISGEHARKVVRLANDLGIWTNGFFIIGLPGETPKTVKRTIDFAKELDLDFASFFIATPYPGTRLYELAASEGYITEEPDWSSFKVLTPAMNIGTMSRAEIASWLRKANREFYRYRILRELSPGKIGRRLKQLRSRDDARLVLRLVRYFISDVLRRGG